MHLPHLIGIIIEQSKNLLRVSIRNGKLFIDLAFYSIRLGILVQGSGREIRIVNVPTNPDGTLRCEALFT